MSETPAPNPWMNLYAKPQRLVRIGSRRRLNVHMTGAGGPAIVLVPGLGGTTFSWIRVQRELAALTTVIAIDHPGFGFSDPGPLPRDTPAIVADLRKALGALGVPAPYVLVGHSAGSFDIQLFAYQHPEEVAALVFVDPSSPRQGERLFPDWRASQRERQALLRRFTALSKAGELNEQTPEIEQVLGPPNPRLTREMNAVQRQQALSASRLRTLASSLREFGGPGGEAVIAAREARRPHPLGDRPVIVLTASLLQLAPDTPAPQAQIDAWRGMHAEIAALSSRGEQRIVESDHGIPTTNPRAVIDAVEEVWRAVSR